MPVPTGLCVAPAQPEAAQALPQHHRGHLLSWATSFLTALRSVSRTSCTTVRSYSDRIWGHKLRAAHPRCAPVGAWAGLPPVPPQAAPCTPKRAAWRGLGGSGQCLGPERMEAAPGWRQEWGKSRWAEGVEGWKMGEGGCAWRDGGTGRCSMNRDLRKAGVCWPQASCIPGTGAWPRRLLSPWHSQRR